METYMKLKKRHQEEINAFPLKFAFSNKQFKEMMEEWGLTETDIDKICSFGYSGFYLKSDAETLKQMLDKHKKERAEASKNKEYLYEMFCCELANHEFDYTRELEDTLDALGYTLDEINENQLLNETLKKVLHRKYDISNHIYYGIK